ncbi:class I SAM-dependent methyltransferase [Methanofollis aquaemaris]|uniref:Class I SAM-dependent methyltransferase n=1 Tax=Methanofollis aquaemaris TaxID=126734 RepID=A0A8A3S5N1_9EURY|nr:class I SAM-dependent methyltransferase [Methanofollis aquaemaris]QSZ67567.1 class I SAM-dependent methyltransferase [Methanofollis aquaemaris]
MERDERSEKEKAEGMDRIAKTIFAPIYPVLAEYFLGRFGRRDGVCIDLGSGPGHLAIAVAKASEMQVYGLDVSEVAHALARKNIREAGLEGRITLISGDVGAIPLPDDSVDLAVSRGSIYFWDDLHAAFREVARILRPGGMTFIGGGFGNAELWDDVVQKMIARNPDWETRYTKNMSSETTARFEEALSRTEGVEGEVVRDESGVWVVMRKKPVP